MTALLAPLEPVPCLRGLDPAAVLREHPRAYLVYLIHLDVPFVVNGYAWRHYIGYCKPGRLAARMIDHRTGTDGSKFLQLCREAGITWHLARVWVVPDGKNAYNEEQRIKRMGGGRRSCPSCGIVPNAERQVHRSADGRYIKPRRRA